MAMKWCAFTNLYVLVVKDVRCMFYMEFVFVDDFLKIFDALVKHMIMCSQVSIHKAHRHTIQLKSNAHSSFITL